MSRVKNCLAIILTIIISLSSIGCGKTKELTLVNYKAILIVIAILEYQ